MINKFKLKLIPNHVNKKTQISFTFKNKDYYSLNSVHKKTKEDNYIYSLLSNDENNNNLIKKRKKASNIYDLNINNVFQKINNKSRNKNETIKEPDTNINFLFFKTKKKIYRYNSFHYNSKDKNEILEPIRTFKNPLIITPLNKIIPNLKKTNKNRINKLIILKNLEYKYKIKGIKRNFTYETFYKTERKKIPKLNRDYISINSMKKKEMNLTNNKKSQGTQININYFHYDNFFNKKTFSIINRTNYCSPKSIIFQRKLKI